MLECLVRQRRREIENNERLLAAMRRMIGDHYQPASPPTADISSTVNKGDHLGKPRQNTLLLNNNYRDDNGNNEDVFLSQSPTKVNEVTTAFPPLPNWSDVRKFGHDAKQQLQITGSHLMDVIKQGGGRLGGAGYPRGVKPFSAVMRG